MKSIKVFTDRYPLLGPLIWILSIQYFISQLITALNFIPSYSIRFNTISDLGNTACGLYSNRIVCSPEHTLMNLSLITLGITMAIGALFIFQEFRENWVTFIGFSFMAIAGFGTVLVGLFPENTVGWLHFLGASLPFFIGNLALILLSMSLRIPKPLAIFTMLAGIFSFLSLALFLSHHYFGLGIGGTERLAAYPQTIWLIIFGLYTSKNHIIRYINTNK